MLTILILWQFVFKVSNAAIVAFLKISKHILLYFGQIFHCDQLKKVGDKFPLTIKTAHQIISLQNNDFESFVVCSSCNSVYEFGDCIERSLTGCQNVSKNVGMCTIHIIHMPLEELLVEPCS